MTEPRRRAPIANLRGADPRRGPAIEAVATWLTGQETATSFAEPDPATEAGRQARAYRMGLSRDTGLGQELLSNDESTRRAAMYGLTAAGDTAIAPALDALASAHWGIRKSGAFVLGEIAARGPNIVEALAAAARDDDKSEVRATAATSLGRIARRSLADGDTSVIDPVIEALAPCLDPVREPDMSRAVVPMNRVRQAAALALLTIVTESIVIAAPAMTLGELAARVEQAYRRETDRYAAGTLLEALSRLTAIGEPKACRLVARHLMLTHWNASPPAR